MTTYLERHGGYRHARETGYAQWILAHAFDAAAQEDWQATREYIALLIAALEQSAMDGMAAGLHLVPDGGSTPGNVPGEDAAFVGNGAAFFPFDPASLGSGGSCLCEGVGCAFDLQDGDQEGGPRDPQGRRGLLNISKSKAKTKVPKEAEGGCRATHLSVDKDFCMTEFDSSAKTGAKNSGGSNRNASTTSPAYAVGGTLPSSTAARSKPATEMSYPKWCALLVGNVLRTRTPFARFLSDSLSMSRSMTSRSASTPIFFPVPVLDFENLGRMPEACSSGVRRKRHLDRAVHTICMALNFWHSGGRWIDATQLQRRPNAEHLTLYQKLTALIRSDGWTASFEISKSGRKAPELIARLSELSILLTARGSPACSYDRTFVGIPVGEEAMAAPEVTPFRDLDASRLKVTGTGHWDATQFLDDELAMAYREPQTLCGGLDVGPQPFLRDSPSEIAALARLWDVNGLLLLHDQPCKRGTLSKVFNSYKNELVDRQIGDRRGRNGLEKKIAGAEDCYQHFGSQRLLSSTMVFEVQILDKHCWTFG